MGVEPRKFVGRRQVRRAGVVGMTGGGIQTAGLVKYYMC